MCRLAEFDDLETRLMLERFCSGKEHEMGERLKALDREGFLRRAVIREEGEFLGAVPKRDVDAVTSSFLGWFRQGREEGRILLIDDDDVIR